MTANNAAERVAEVERRWVDLERRRRALSDERIRAVNDARDAGMSLGEIARTMSSSGRPVAKSQVVHLLACGYPESAGDDPEAA